jgi:hypothetical protein
VAGQPDIQVAQCMLHNGLPFASWPALLASQHVNVKAVLPSVSITQLYKSGKKDGAIHLVLRQLYRLAAYVKRSALLSGLSPRC